MVKLNGSRKFDAPPTGSKIFTDGDLRRVHEHIEKGDNLSIVSQFKENINKFTSQQLGLLTEEEAKFLQKIA
mgnify:CR=1 FL=1